MTKKQVILTVMGVMMIFVASASADIIDLSPTVHGDVSPTGGTSYFYRNGGNVSTYWQGATDNYAIISEFDIDAYESKNLVNATLTFTVNPLWGLSNHLRLAQISSDLQITAADNSSNPVHTYFYPGTYLNNVTVTVDVTTELAAAMDSASGTQGIAFRLTEWTPTANLGGCIMNDSAITLSMNMIPEPATMGLLSIGGLAMALKRKRNRKI